MDTERRQKIFHQLPLIWRQSTTVDMALLLCFRIEKSRYIDRIVHRWVVDNFLVPYFVPTFINTTYACLKGRGMHKACLDVQKAMLHCKRIWNEYYILKMDIKKYFENINKNKRASKRNTREYKNILKRKLRIRAK